MRRLIPILALALVLVACDGGTATTTPESTTTSTSTTSTTTTTLLAGLNLYEVICFPVIGAPQTGLNVNECEGDETYASVTLFAPALMEGMLATMVAELGFPSSLPARVGNTRSLDGTLTAESPDGYSASWTYHPDDGLSLVVESD